LEFLPRNGELQATQRANSREKLRGPFGVSCSPIANAKLSNRVPPHFGQGLPSRIGFGRSEGISI
jgi:hypothetical protein